MVIEILCAIVFGVIATVLAVTTIVQSYVQWRAQTRYAEVVVFLAVLLTIARSNQQTHTAVPGGSSRTRRR
jgi:hypothetical protein